MTRLAIVFVTLTGLLSCAEPVSNAPPPDTPEGACADIGAPSAQLRLLTRRELNDTLRDLLRDAEPTCAATRDCDAASESCVEGRCRLDGCATRTFLYDPQGRQLDSVHVAGSFNGWPGTVGDGGWALEREGDRWLGKFELPDGDHQYKLVLNDSEWITDPANPDRAPDGFGGENSALNVACAGAAEPLHPARNWASTLPPESRPPEYPFDNSADAGLVTSVHVDEQLRIAREAAELVTARLDRFVPCAGEAGCAQTFVDDFATRAFRRPPTNEERGRLATLIEGAETFEDGVSLAVQVILASPQVLYRSELGTAANDGRRVLTTWELASALSYTLTGSMPDDELFAAAAAGDLDVEAHARRLVDTPRARAHLERFALMWLGVENATQLNKSSRFAGFENVSDDMVEEAAALFSHVTYDSTGRFDELFTTDAALASPDLVAWYGNAPEARAGILTLGAVLSTGAYPDQTSPVRRGLFVRQRLLCHELGIPPPDAAMIPDIDPNASTRERFEQHSGSPQCAGCHVFIDDIGFGMEHYDPVGRWRDDDNGHTIDPTGILRDLEFLGAGTEHPFSSLPELAGILSTSSSAPECFVEQTWRFAMGRTPEPAQRCSVERAVKRFEEADRDIRELFLGLVTDPSFAIREEVSE
jgi:hypothetical protein